MLRINYVSFCLDYSLQLFAVVFNKFSTNFQPLFGKLLKLLKILWPSGMDHKFSIEFKSGLCAGE